MNEDLDWKALRAWQDKHESGMYPMKDVCLVRGLGAELWDERGKSYLDCGASYGVCNAGHGNPDVVKAIREQVQQLTFVQATYYTEQRSRLLEKMANLTGLERIFLCNSGTEATESAIKFARATTGKKEVIATVFGFHGRTMGALSATWKEKYRKPFEPLVPGFSHIPFNNAQKLREAITPQTAAFIIEPVQGEGGVRLADKEYLREVREICDEKDVMLIFDEVQTGFCRTGKFFAKEHSGVQPDYLCLAKSIANGIPMGAMACAPEKVPGEKLIHGTTFGGSPLACAASLATIGFMEKKKLWEQADENGKYFMSLLRKIESPLVRETRGLGLMVGMELKDKPQEILERLLRKGVLANPAGTTVLRFLPPLVISKEQLRFAAEKTGEALAGK